MCRHPRRTALAAFRPSLVAVAGGFPRRDTFPGWGESESSCLVALCPAGDRRRLWRVFWMSIWTQRKFVFGLRCLSVRSLSNIWVSLAFFHLFDQIDWGLHLFHIFIWEFLSAYLSSLRVSNAIPSTLKCWPQGVCMVGACTFGEWVVESSLYVRITFLYCQLFLNKLYNFHRATPHISTVAAISVIRASSNKTMNYLSVNGFYFSCSHWAGWRQHVGIVKGPSEGMRSARAPVFEKLWR